MPNSRRPFTTREAEAIASLLGVGYAVPKISDAGSHVAIRREDGSCIEIDFRGILVKEGQRTLCIPFLPSKVEPRESDATVPLSFPERVAAEVQRARKIHPRAYASHHEAHDILCEEVDEYRVEVRKKTEHRDKSEMLKELVHVGAVAQRAAEDLGLVQR